MGIKVLLVRSASHPGGRGTVVSVVLIASSHGE